MARRYYSSSAADTTLTGTIAPGATAMVVGAITGLPLTFPYTLILDPGTASEEVVSVTGGTGTSLTVARGQDGTTALTHTVGAVVRHGVSARDFDEPNAHIQLATGVHGVAGSVVGTSDAQTLTNKSINLSSNTLTGTKAQFNTAISDADMATLTGTETLTNKTISSPTITNPTIATGQADNLTGAWTAYTPTLTSFTATINYARWMRIGKMIHVDISLTLNAPLPGGVLFVSLPVLRRVSDTGVVGTAFVALPGPQIAVAACVMDGSNANFVMASDGLAAYWQKNTPVPWAGTETIYAQLCYEAA